MAIPAGYRQDNDGNYWHEDGTGPYGIDAVGEVATILAGDQITADPTGYTRGPNGLYYSPEGYGPFALRADGIYVYISGA